jgi:glycine/D-amino acid oxidase-like deaminating enzyme
MVNPRVLVVGGGIAGLATARALLQRGIEPDVVERAPTGGDPAELAEQFGEVAEPVPTGRSRSSRRGADPASGSSRHRRIGATARGT